MTGNRKSKFFYGYVIVSIVFLIMVVIGGTLYTFGVFFKPLSGEFGWTRAAISGAFSVYMFVHGFLYIVTGRLNDRFGPRIVMTGCGFFLGLGYLLMSQIGAIWQLYLFYGLIIAIGMSGSFIPLVSTVARWFVKRRGLMTGIVVSGIGVGTVVMPPVASQLISTYGWCTSYIIIGIIALVLIVIAAQFLRRDPGQMGQLPDGEGEVKQEGLISEARGFSLQGAIHTRQFWMLCAMFLCFGFCLQTIMVHIVIYTTELGISETIAAYVLAIIGGGSIVGRIVMGGATDRIGNKLALIICFILMSIALVWLVAVKEVWTVYLFAAIFGFAYGGLVAIQSPSVANLFGMSSHGVILGAIAFSTTIGSAIGPVVAGHIFDITNSYQLAFLICIAMGVTGLVLTLPLRPISSEGGRNDSKGSP